MKSRTSPFTAAGLLFAVLAIVAPAARSQTFTTTDPPGSQGTSPVSINPAGQIVGNYFDANFVTHGTVDQVIVQRSRCPSALYLSAAWRYSISACCLLRERQWPPCSSCASSFGLAFGLLLEFFRTQALRNCRNLRGP
jgi:hypothetical protein